MRLTSLPVKEQKIREEENRPNYGNNNKLSKKRLRGETEKELLKIFLIFVGFVTNSMN